MILKISSTICIGNPSNESSFSKLKLIKTDKQSTMGQNRLSSWALISIEKNLAKKIDFNECAPYRVFLEAKARKMPFVV